MIDHSLASSRCHRSLTSSLALSVKVVTMHPLTILVPLILATGAHAAVLLRAPSLNHFAMQDALMSPASINAVGNTCGPTQGRCDPDVPGGGWCCSVHVCTLLSTYLTKTDIPRAIVVMLTQSRTLRYLLTFLPGNNSEYCGEGCQDEFGFEITAQEWNILVLIRS